MRIKNPLLAAFALVSLAPIFSTHEAQGQQTIRARGTIRDADAPNDGPLFQIEYEHTSLNNKALSTEIRQCDLKGELLVLEKTRYDEQGRMKKYSLEQKQTNSSADVEVAQGKVLMSWTQAGKTKSAVDTASENTVAAGSLMSYMSAHINSLQQGRTVDIRLAVPERGSVFNFTIRPRNEKCGNNAGDLCVNLGLSNFFLKKLVKPIDMNFQKSAEGFRPLSLEAPSVVLRKKGNSLEKFTARIEYPRL